MLGPDQFAPGPGLATVRPVAPGAAAVALSFALDRLVGEPPRRFHPVAWFGQVVGRLDRDWNRPLAVGAAGAIALPLLAAGVTWIFVRLATVLAPYAGVVAAGGVLFATTSLRMLLEEAAGVIAASEVDPEAARDRLPSLAGRSPDGLSPGQLRSAAVESAAENLADGLVGPLLAFAVLAPASLALGTAGAAWVKAVNTMDSMLGYPDEPVGTTAARLDDLVMWLPARVAAALIALAVGSPDPALSARRWARAPSSPNAGWPMGTIAAALQVRLEKPGAYELNSLADLPSVAAAERGVALAGRAGVLAYAIAALAGVVAWL